MLSHVSAVEGPAVSLRPGSPLYSTSPAVCIRVSIGFHTRLMSVVIDV